MSTANKLLTPQDFEDFLSRYDISDARAALIFGVTNVTIYYWLKGKRNIGPMASKLIRFLDAYPEQIERYQNA